MAEPDTALREESDSAAPARRPANTALFAAADGGGSKTAFALADANGTVLFQTTLGASNPNAVGLQTAIDVLSAGFRAVREAAGETPVALFYAGVSGALSGGNDEKLAKVLAPLFGRIVVESDVMNTVFSATAPGKCVAAIAGTGSAVFAYDGRELVRGGGWGYLLDTEGGGFDVGRDVLRLCLECESAGAASGRDGDPPALVRRAERKIGGRVVDHLGEIYGGGPGFVASFAPLAFALAREGDGQARRLVRKAAARIAELALSLKARVDCGDTLVVSGGLLKDADVFVPMLEDALGGLLSVEVPSCPPLVGAIRRCMALAGAAVAPAQAFGVPCPAPAKACAASAQAGFATEGRNELTRRFDALDTVAMLRLICDADLRSVEAVRSALGPITRAVDAVAAAFADGGRLFYIGAGTSGRLATVDASECPPTFGVDSGLVVPILAGGDKAMRNAVENVEDDAETGWRDLQVHGPTPRDVVMGISASGSARYVAGALERAKALGCRTISLSSCRDCRIAGIAEIAIFTDTGAEVISGSTRMKAGNAQKMVLNMVTTCAMAKTGKVRGNLMVNLRPTNEKLRRRMVSIVAELAGIGPDAALAALESAGFDIPAALRQIDASH